MTNRMTNVIALQTAIETLSTIEGFDTEALAKLGNIKATYEKKSASNGERKPTPNQVANEGVKNDILEVLRANDRMTVTDITKALPYECSVSKASALLRQLLEVKLVARVEEKRKAYYSAV